MRPRLIFAYELARQNPGKLDEVPPPHSITSSARTRNDSGIFRPIACSLQIHDQLELDRHLHWKIGRHYGSPEEERDVKTGKPGAQTDQTRTTVEITTAALEDVVGIQDVLYRTWLATYPSEMFGINVDDIEEMYKDRNSEETLAKRREQVSRPQETTLVAKEKDKVVGLCRIIKRKDKSVMEAIYILPEYQRLGIGSSVWREAQKLLDPKKDVVVQVATYNTDAIEFYKRRGFRDTGKRWAEEKFRLKSGAVIPAMEMIIKGKKE
jgi:ribosomal protein S18 acetylase RimI-like enzyme